MSQNFLTSDDKYIPSECFFGDVPDYKPMTRLSDNIGESMKMMADIQKLREQLPGTDCGACGAPNSRALAEDVIKGERSVDACIIKRFREETAKPKSEDEQ